MQSPGYITERSSSWRDVAATWIVAGIVLGLVGLSGSLFGYRSQHPSAADLPVMTALTEPEVGRQSIGYRQSHRVSAEVSIPTGGR